MQNHSIATATAPQQTIAAQPQAPALPALDMFDLITLNQAASAALARWDAVEKIEDVPRWVTEPQANAYGAAETKFRAACKSVGVDWREVPDEMPRLPFYDSETGVVYYEYEREQMQRRECRKRWPVGGAE